MLTKVCTKCGVEKGVNSYNKNKLGKYGVIADCKCCRAEHYQANREAIAEQSKAYRQANKEAIAERKKAYYEANKETIAAKTKVYYEVNKEAKLEYQSAYKKANPHLINALNAKRKARKLQATPAWADPEAIKGMYELAALFNCTGMNIHVDHIVPLISDTVCGLHCEANLQLLPASDNMSKGNRQWPDM